MNKYELYQEIRSYIETTYGAYSLENIGNQRKFSIGWDYRVANEIHTKLLNDFGLIKLLCHRGKAIDYNHDNGLHVSIYLDETQAPARYYVQFGYLF
jgi:hypothetical protein